MLILILETEVQEFKIFWNFENFKKFKINFHIIIIKLISQFSKNYRKILQIHKLIYNQ